MKSLIKKTVTEMTFMEQVSEVSNMRYLKLRYDSEGAGRYFELSDETNFNGNGNVILLSSSDDFLMLYEAAKEMEDQGSIYVEHDGC